MGQEMVEVEISQTPLGRLGVAVRQDRVWEGKEKATVCLSCCQGLLAGRGCRSLRAFPWVVLEPSQSCALSGLGAHGQVAL